MKYKDLVKKVEELERRSNIIANYGVEKPLDTTPKIRKNFGEMYPDLNAILNYQQMNQSGHLQKMRK